MDWMGGRGRYPSAPASTGECGLDQCKGLSVGLGRIMDTIPWRCYCLIEQSDLHWLAPSSAKRENDLSPQITRDRDCLYWFCIDWWPSSGAGNTASVPRREMAPRVRKLWKKLNKSDLSFHWNCLCLSLSLWNGSMSVENILKYRGSDRRGFAWGHAELGCSKLFFC